MKKTIKSICIILVMSLMLQMAPGWVFAAENDAEYEENADTVQEELRVVGELTEKRGEYEKHFVMSDGSIVAAIYDEPVHYKDGDEWVNVDSRMETVKNRSGEDAYKSTAGRSEITLGANASDSQMAEYTADGYTLSWGIVGANEAELKPVTSEKNKADGALSEFGVANVKTTAMYSDVFSGVDVYYTVTSGKLKEDIVLKSDEAQRSFEFEIAAEGLKAELMEDNSVVLSDAEGKEVFTIAAPFMYDAAYADSTQIKVSIEQDEEGIVYTITADDEWLDAPEREYPVIIDPIVTTAFVQAPIKETYVSKEYPNTVVGNAKPYIKIGNSTGTSVENEGYIRFNEMPSIIGNNLIINAVLVLNPHKRITNNNTYCNQHSFNVNPIISAHAVTSSWVIGSMAWSNKAPYSADILDYEELEAAASADNREYEWNITETVRKWYSGAMANNGIALKMYEPTPQSTSWRNAYFTSSDYSSTPSSYYPYLYINYRNTDGLEGYNSYHSMEINGSGTVHINDYNGDVVYESPAIGWFTGERQNTSAFYLVYSNNAANSTSDMGYSFGKGVRLNVSQRLRSSGIASYPYYLIDADGTKHYLYEDGTGTGVYKDEDGMGLTMTLMNVPGTPVNNDEYYLITDKVGNQMKYDIWGYLRREIDANGNTTRYNYSPNSTLGDNYLSSIQDPSGRYISLTYNTSNYRLTKVKNPDNWETTFTYDANGCLTQISDAAGTTKLEYGTVGGQYRLIKVYEKSSSTSGRHYIKLKYESASPYRADGIGEGVEGVTGSEYDIYTDIEYGYNQTKFTDYAGRKETIQFDIYGNPVCVLDSDGNASVYDFKNTSYRHKVTRAAASQKYVDNQMADPMFLGSISDYDIEGTAGVTASIDTTEHFFSTQSIKLSSSDPWNFKYIKCYSGTTPVAGKTYTMSAYIKTKNVEKSQNLSNIATVGAGIRMMVIGSEDYREIYSEMYSGTTDTSIDNGWRKVSATVTLGEDETISLISVGIIMASGEVYIGGVQFEEGGAANKINLLENSSFEHNNGTDSVPDCWSGNANMGVGGDYSAWTIGTAYQCDGTWSARIVGNLRKDKYIKTELPVKGDEGDVFILSAQAMAQNALPIKDGRAQFKIEAVLTYDDNTTETFSRDFNPAVKVWQYRALTVVCRKDYKKLELRLRYDHNCGWAFFDTVTVYKDSTQSFVYDDSGNMVSATEYANSSIYSFDKNILTKTTTEAGTGAETAYDDNKNPVFVGTSEGVSQSTVYGTGALQGRPLSSIMEASEYSGAVINENSYYIRSKANGKFLAPGTGGYVYLSSYAGTAAQRWKITRQEDGYFRFSPQSNESNSLDTNGSNSYGEIPTYVYTSHNGDNQRFNLVRNADGSYHITSKYAEGKALTISSRTETPNLIILAPYTGAANQCFYLTETGYGSSGGTELMKSAQPEDGGVYSFRVKYSGQVIANSNGGTENGTLLVQNYPSVTEETRKRQYKLHEVSVAGNTYYTIESVCASGKFIGCNQSNQLTISTYTAGSEPKWQFILNAGTYKLRLYGQSKYICLSSESNTEGTGFSMESATSDRSYFTLERVSESLNGSVEYTSNGNYITHTTDSAGNTVTYDYDANSGRLNWYDDAEGYRTNYTYDSTTKRLIEVKVGTGTQPMVTYAYNNNGSLASITRNGFTYTFGYDGYGNRTTVSIGDRTLSTNTYEAHNGNLTQVEYGNGDTVHYAYDSLDRLSEKWYDNDATNKNTVTYDAVGNVASTYDAATHRTVQYTYDLAGRLLSKNVIDNTNSPVTRQRVVYGYDKYNRTANVQREFGSYSYTTGYEYGSNSRTAILESLKLNGDTKIAYDYDPLMRLDEKTLHLDNTTYTTKYSYVPGEKENSTTMLLAGIKNGGDAEITYTYDARGNIKTVSEGGVLKQTYHYDKLNQLIRVDDTVTNCTYGYRYNAGGNLTGMDVYDQYIDPDDPDYTSYNLLTTRDYRYQDSGNWKDLLTYYFGSTITYDDIGNPLNYRNGMTMTWEKGRRLASVTNSGVTTAYTYNDDGIRLTKKVGNNALITYETDGGKVLCQRTRIGTNDIYVFFFYDESGNAYAMKYDGDMYYYLRNGQGDVIGIIDDTGAVVARYTYDPWGKPLTVKDGNGVDIAANATHVANANPFRYRGYFYDVETGFYYLQSRYYDPVTGRFINADGYVSTGQGVLGNNMFTYCGNNPVNLVDPSGQCFLADAIKPLIDALCKAVEYVHSTIRSSIYSYFSRNVYSDNILNRQGGESVFRGQPRIDTDGSDGTIPDKYWRAHTSLSKWKGKTATVLDAYVMPYVVMPNGAGAKLGDLAVLINWDTGQYVECIVGDVGKKDSGWGEVSIAALWKTGYPNHKTANSAHGITSNYEIILYPGVSFGYDWSWGYRVVEG